MDHTVPLCCVLDTARGVFPRSRDCGYIRSHYPTVLRLFVSAKSSHQNDFERYRDLAWRIRNGGRQSGRVAIVHYIYSSPVMKHGGPRMDGRTDNPGQRLGRASSAQLILLSHKCERAASDHGQVTARSLSMDFTEVGYSRFRRSTGGLFTGI
jgi:hypothetical protein